MASACEAKNNEKTIFLNVLIFLLTNHNVGSNINFNNLILFKPMIKSSSIANLKYRELQVVRLWRDIAI